jgi:hypothetical protein
MQMFNAPAMPEDLREPGAGLVMRSLDASDFDKGYVALLGQVGPLESLHAVSCPVPLTSRASRRTADTGTGAGPRSVDGAISEDARQVNSCLSRCMGALALGPTGQVPHRACVAGSKSYYTVVVEDVAASKIVATATLLVEVLVVPARMPCRVLVEGSTSPSSVRIAIVRPFRPSHARRVMPRTCAGTCWQYKFLRGGHLAGHIEDVVVDASQRYACCLDLLFFDNVWPWGEFCGRRALDTRINASAPPGAFTSHTFGTWSAASMTCCSDAQGAEAAGLCAKKRSSMSNKPPAHNRHRLCASPLRMLSHPPLRLLAMAFLPFFHASH